MKICSSYGFKYYRTIKFFYFIIKPKLEYLTDESKNFFVTYMVTLWCIRNITISISVHANSLLWHVYIKYEWQLIVRLGQHGLIDALYTYPCMTSHYVDIIDDAISPSSVRAVIICDVFEIIRLWGHWLHVEKNSVIYIPFYGLPMKSNIGKY